MTQSQWLWLHSPQNQKKKTKQLQISQLTATTKNQNSSTCFLMKIVNLRDYICLILFPWVESVTIFATPALTCGPKHSGAIRYLSRMINRAKHNVVVVVDVVGQLRKCRAPVPFTIRFSRRRDRVPPSPSWVINHDTVMA